MITGKQRAYLRGVAQKLTPIFQIGKEGVTESVIAAIDEAIEKRELIKVNILETAFLDTREACDMIAAQISAEPVQAIGNKFVLYRQAGEEKNRKIEIPVAKVKR